MTKFLVPSFIMVLLQHLQATGLRNLYLRKVKAILGTFSVTYFCSPPHICACTRKSSRTHGLDFVCRQVSLSNFPMFDLIQGLETPQGLHLVFLWNVYTTTVRSLEFACCTGNVVKVTFSLTSYSFELPCRFLT